MNFHDTHGFFPLMDKSIDPGHVGKCLLLCFLFFRKMSASVGFFFFLSPCFREIKRAFIIHKSSFIVPNKHYFSSISCISKYILYMLARIQKTKALPVVLIWRHFIFYGAVQKKLNLSIISTYLRKHLVLQPGRFHLYREPSMLSLALFSFLLSFIWVTAGFSQICTELKDCI